MAQIKKQNKLGKDSRKISLRDFVWNGFNYTVTITFASSFGVLTATDHLGLNLIWIWVLMAIIAGTVAFAFAKLARQHNSKSNGAGYVYARTNMGRMTGLLVGFMQYVYIPFSITYQLVSMIKSSLGAGYINPIDGVYPWYVLNFGSFTYLYLDLIAIAIFVLCSLTIFGGIRFFKKMTNYSSFVKWGAFFFLFLLAVVLACMNGKSNMQYWSSDSSFTFGGFVGAFNSCFLAFAGFEVFSTAGKNIENPSKNISKGIILVMIISATFYILCTILFFLAFTDFSQNINMFAWARFMNDPKLKWLYYVGPIIMLIGILGLRVNSMTQKSFYAGTIVQPMSEEGFFPESFGVLSKKDNMSVKASFLNIVITLIVAFIWLIIPDIISGVRGATSQKDDIFRINDFQAMATVICIFVYIMAMISIVKLGFEGKMKITILEWIMYFVASAFLVFFFVMYYEELIRVNILNGDTTQKVRAFISIGFTLMCLIFFFIWYGVYYHVKQKMRSTQYQTKLDNNFKLDDDWFVVENFTNNKFTRINKIYANPRMSTSWKKKILNRLFNKTNLEIQSFQRRNLKIYANKHNANLLKSQILFKRLSTLKQQTISKI